MFICCVRTRNNESAYSAPLNPPVRELLETLDVPLDNDESLPPAGGPDPYTLFMLRLNLLYGTVQQPSDLYIHFLPFRPPPSEESSGPFGDSNARPEMRVTHVYPTQLGEAQQGMCVTRFLLNGQGEVISVADGSSRARSLWSISEETLATSVVFPLADMMAPEVVLAVVVVGVLTADDSIRSRHTLTDKDVQKAKENSIGSVSYYLTCKLPFDLHTII